MFDPIKPNLIFCSLHIVSFSELLPWMVAIPQVQDGDVLSWMGRREGSGVIQIPETAIFILHFYIFLCFPLC